MSRLFHWLLRLARTRESYAYALAVAAIAGYVSSELYRWGMEEDFRERFNDQAWFAASNLTSETMNGQAMGTALLLGLNEPELKELVEGRRKPEDPDCLTRLRAVRQLLNANGILVFNNLGDTVAHEAPFTMTAGSEEPRRPFWQQAIRGNQVVYPAVGSQAPDRKLFIAAPIWAGTLTSSELVGAVVVEMAADYLDYQIGVGGAQALLLSPQGVVFAATDKDWLFRLAHEMTVDELNEVRKLGQFGMALPDAVVPERLPFDLNQNLVKLGGIRHVRAIAPVRWNDPSGDWMIVVFGDLRAAVSRTQRAVVGAVAGLLALALLELLLRAVRYEAARREAVSGTEAAARELASAAQRRLHLSEITMALQKARDPEALAALFFRQLAEILPLHQASLYFIDPSQSDWQGLELAGCYGTEGAPERVNLGEGLLGQCAVDQQPLLLVDVPAGFWRVSSGLGESTPGVLMLFPLLANQTVLGVLELASMESGFCSSKALVESLLPVLSMNLEILLAERLSERQTIAACVRNERQNARQVDQSGASEG
jgi:hypothetical protein